MHKEYDIAETKIHLSVLHSWCCSIHHPMFSFEFDSLNEINVLSLLKAWDFKETSPKQLLCKTIVTVF